MEIVHAFLCDVVFNEKSEPTDTKVFLNSCICAEDKLEVFGTDYTRETMVNIDGLHLQKIEGGYIVVMSFPGDVCCSGR